MKQTTVKSAIAEGSVAQRGLATARALEMRYPELAREFLGLFSYTTSSGHQSFAAVGREFQIECAADRGGRLRFRLLHRAAIEREVTYAMQGGSLHDEVFRAAANFTKQVRSLLVAKGVPPSTAILGGWRSGTHPQNVSEPLIFTIPRVCCRISSSEVSVSTFEPGDCVDMARDLAESSCALPAASRLIVAKKQEIPECRDYIDDLVDLIGELSQEAMDKVVICREVRLSLQNEISPLDVLSLAASRTNARYEYVFRWSDANAWVGISPETLVKKNGAQITVEPLAGTRKSSQRTEKHARYRDELVHDAKEVEEHEIAACLFHENLALVCEPESIEQIESRAVIDLGYVQHLKSTIRGRLRTGVELFELLGAIYPPATIWGKPIAISGDRIRTYERIEREFYTGGLGFFTLEDDAHFALAIRTARVSSREVRVYAGSGIVKRSDPYREWLETTNKMQPFLGE